MHKTTKALITCLAGIFLLLCIIFIPFTFYLFPFQQNITQILFGELIKKAASLLLGVSLKNIQVYSDSVSMYILFFILLLLAAVITIFLTSLKQLYKRNLKIYNFCTTACCYYLIIILLKYGLDKIFKTQFYLPEPNTLFTTVGHLDKDILFWSTMGSSHLYNTITGCIEILAAVLLFFKPTRLAGVLLSIIVLLQVVLINFSFNISVKLFSLLLLSMTFYLFLPYSRRLIAAIFTNSTIKAIPTLANNKKQLFTLFLKCFIGGLFLLEGFYPYLNFGENKSATPYLHGAYEVKKITILNEELTQPHFLYTRFFIHKNGYIIFEDSNRIMKDFALQYDTINQKLFLTDYKKNTTTLDYKYSDTDSTLILNYTLNNKPVTIFGKAIDWRKLPLLKDDFDWTSD